MTNAFMYYMKFEDTIYLTLQTMYGCEYTNHQVCKCRYTQNPIGATLNILCEMMTNLFLSSCDKSKNLKTIHYKYFYLSPMLSRTLLPIYTNTKTSQIKALTYTGSSA